MSAVTIALIVVGVVVLIIIVLAIRGWIIIFNKFQYWFNRAQRCFADIDVITQQRLDNIHALAQIVKKYDIHEYQALKDVIEARSRWTKNASLNEKVKLASEIESNYFKIQAIFEKYPNLKADQLHRKLMERDTNVESRLRKTRLDYNRVAQKYNQRVKIFPRNIVASVHHFKPLDYLKFTEQEPFEPKELFEDK
jgi:LemA protein